MLSIPNYKIIAKISESSSSVIYSAINNKNNQTVILKVHKKTYPTFEELTRYQHEYEILCKLADLRGVVNVYSIEKYQNTLVMCLDDFGGKSLKIWLKKRVFTLDELLSLAIHITDILGKIHLKKIIHKNINPSNIVFNPSTGKLKFIDFGIATQLSRQYMNPNVLEGTLAYMSPEQTGRMNRVLDYRTDFYSLGVTLYELFTGKLPFDTKDAMELVHCHLAKQAVPPNQINPELPIAISNIILKLLEKTADNRYQSAWGIKADLEKVKENQSGLQFELAQNDIYDRFQIPKKLYGREAEIKTLLAAFERVVSGNTEIMLVAGYSGIGKSVLVKELSEKKLGYFIQGKFDQFQRNIPYSAIVNAFSELVQQLLTECKLSLHSWKEKLLSALGSNGQIIIDVIPKIELIIGKQAAVPQLGFIESQNRFNLVFKNFIQVFCEAEHPLVIFLDDLQWVDLASLNLLERLLTNTSALFLIGAYRDNEVDSTHSLMMTLDKLGEKGVIINKIILNPLTFEDVNQLIADSLHQDKSAVISLTYLVMRKTKGNPFFVNQFLHTLYEDKLLTFKTSEVLAFGWTWDIKKIECLNITDNVVELMIGKLKKLPESAQQVLRLAACIGNRFDLDTLSIIYKKTATNTLQDLNPALTEGFIILPSSSLEIAFLHDRVQQAAYALIDDEQKKAVHLQIGRLLLINTHQEKLEEHIFDIVGHFNIGIELVENQAEKNEIARMNLLAAQKAKAATAYGAAIKYLNIGRKKCLAKNSWVAEYDLTLNLYVELLEAKYLNTNYEQAEKLSEVVLQHAQTVLDKTKVYQTHIQFYITQNQMQAAINVGLHVLEILDISLSKLPPHDFILEDLYHLPNMTNAHKLAAMRILMIIFVPAKIVNLSLMQEIVFTMVNLCIKHGNSSLASVAYAYYGLVLCVKSDIALGYKFGKLALSLLETEEIRCRVVEIVNGFIIPWQEHAKNSIEPLRNNIQVGLETGDVDFAGFSALVCCENLFFVGEALNNVSQVQSSSIGLLQNLKQQFQLYSAQILGQLVLNLSGKGKNSVKLVGVLFNEEEILPILGKKNIFTLLFRAYLAKLILSYLFKNYTEAVANASQLAKYEQGGAGLLLAAEQHFYCSLALLAQSVSPARQKKYLEKVAIKQQKMRLWAMQAPMNFQHKYDLVEAEKARVLGEDLIAMDLYEKAIAGARENEYLHEEALAYELAAEFYLGRGMDKFAQTYMNEAIYRYKLWGAKRKVEALEDKYPQWVSHTSSTVIATKLLDLNSIIKASQTLSREIVLSKLVEKMMQIVIENAGAETGYLLLEKDNQWFFKDDLPINPDKIAISIVNYVARTQEAVILDDAATTGSFSNDSYILAQKSKSILCVPLLNQGKLTGIFYLENNLVAAAFTAKRVETVQLLGAQAAVSLDNARLYKNLAEYSRTLEEKVAERTLELRENEVQLRQAKESAEAANRAKSSFLANMSHELRTPLHAILGFSQLMERESATPKQLESLGIISRSGEHLLSLINDVLEMSKIEAGQMTLNEECIDFHQTLSDIANMMRIRAENKELQFVMEHDSRLVPFIKIDAGKLRQILINLIGNGIKYTQSGGVSLRVRSMELEKQDKNCRLLFEIEDSGVGIAENDLETIFDAFAQVGSHPSGTEGTGLGLPITRHYIQLLGGDVEVRSTIGEGSLFKFEILAAKADAGSIESKISRHIVGLAPRQQVPRILIVEDNEENRLLMKNLLLDVGFEVREAVNGKAGLKLFEQWHPHLIWMDMRMPVMNGYEAIQGIKSTIAGQKTVVIAMTASAFEKEREKIMATGCDDFVRKPFREEKLFEVIAKYLKIKYLYDDKTETKTETKTEQDLIPAKIVALPKELLDELGQALKELDMDSVDLAINNIGEQDEILAKAMMVYADNFQYKQLDNLINSIKG